MDYLVAVAAALPSPSSYAAGKLLPLLVAELLASKEQVSALEVPVDMAGGKGEGLLECTEEDRVKYGETITAMRDLNLHPEEALAVVSGLMHLRSLSFSHAEVAATAASEQQPGSEASWKGRGRTQSEQ